MSQTTMKRPQGVSRLNGHPILSLTMTLIVAFLMVAVGAGMAFGQPRPAKTVKVADGVYSTKGPMGIYFAQFIVTKAGVVVFDAPHPGLVKPMLAEIRKVTTQPIRYLIYSHNHWDHLKGSKLIKKTGAIVISHAKTKASLAERPHPMVAQPDFAWSGNRYDLKVGGRTFELHHFGASHGEGMTVLRLPKDKILIITDLVTPKRLAFMTMPDFSPMNWLRTLKEIEKMDYDTVLFSHGAHSGPRSAVAEQRQYLEDLYAAVKKGIAAGGNPFMVPYKIKLPKYEKWAFYKQWLPRNAERILLEGHMGW